MKFYYHAWLDHIVNQTKELTELHMSLGMLSSELLEANNEFAKAVLRRLPGGGMRKAKMSYLPLQGPAGARLPQVYCLFLCGTAHTALPQLGRTW
jgi:hypothetical protein